MKHSECLICRCKWLSKILGYEAHHLYKCENCGFVFSIEIPTKDQLVKYYNNYSRQDYDSPITRKRYNELLDEMEKYRSTNNLLDIGCGIGYFLEEARKRGWNVYGTEYTDEAIEICSKKGFNMHQGELKVENYKKEFFDVITSFEVLEHINNPQTEIKNIKTILRRDGLFYFTIPNFNSFSRHLMKNDWSVICYPEHLSYYTPKTINYLLGHNGLMKKKLISTGISITRYKKTVKNDKQPLISKQSDDEKFREMAENDTLISILKNTINFALTVTGKGDTIKGFFIKS